MLVRCPLTNQAISLSHIAHYSGDIGDPGQTIEVNAAGDGLDWVDRATGTLQDAYDEDGTADAEINLVQKASKQGIIINGVDTVGTSDSILEVAVESAGSRQVALRATSSPAGGGAPRPIVYLNTFDGNVMSSGTTHSVVGGQATSIPNRCSHSFIYGKTNTSTALCDDCTCLGNTNTLGGITNRIIGDNNIVTDDDNIVIGSDNNVSIITNVVVGSSNVVEPGFPGVYGSALVYGSFNYTNGRNNSIYGFNVNAVSCDSTHVYGKNFIVGFVDNATFVGDGSRGDVVFDKTIYEKSVVSAANGGCHILTSFQEGQGQTGDSPTTMPVQSTYMERNLIVSGLTQNFTFPWGPPGANTSATVEAVIILKDSTNAVKVYKDFVFVDKTTATVNVTNLVTDGAGASTASRAWSAPGLGAPLLTVTADAVSNTVAMVVMKVIFLDF